MPGVATGARAPDVDGLLGPHSALRKIHENQRLCIDDQSIQHPWLLGLLSGGALLVLGGLAALAIRSCRARCKAGKARGTNTLV